MVCPHGVISSLSALFIRSFRGISVRGNIHRIEAKKVPTLSEQKLQESNPSSSSSMDSTPLKCPSLKEQHSSPCAAGCRCQGNVEEQPTSSVSESESSAGPGEPPAQGRARWPGRAPSLLSVQLLGRSDTSPSAGRAESEALVESEALSLKV